MPGRLRAVAIVLAVVAAAAAAGPNRRPASQPTSAATPEEKLSAECAKVARDMLAKMDKSFRATVVPPFVVIGNLSHDELKRYAVGSMVSPAEAMWKSYFKARPTRPIVALLFKDDKTYRHWAKELFGDTDLPHFGYCRSADGIMVMNISTGGGTLVHELTHALIAYDFPNVPAWFNEGLGSLHEQCRIQRDRVVGLVNWRLPQLQKAIKAGTLRPLSELFELSSWQFAGKDRGLNYGQARYFVMYMQQKGLLKKFYAAFHKRKGKDAVKTVEEVFGRPMKDVESAYLKWVMTLRWGP